MRHVTRLTSLLVVLAMNASRTLAQDTENWENMVRRTPVPDGTHRVVIFVVMSALGVVLALVALKLGRQAKIAGGCLISIIFIFGFVAWMEPHSAREFFVWMGAGVGLFLALGLIVTAVDGLLERLSRHR